MNPFTTDHPLASGPSWFNDHPRLSFACDVVFVALIFTPFLLFGLYRWAMSDVGADNPFPEPWRALGLGLSVAFGASLFCACPIVVAYRLLARRGRRRYAA
jgi:hypothetical protein